MMIQPGIVAAARSALGGLAVEVLAQAITTPTANVTVTSPVSVEEGALVEIVMQSSAVVSVTGLGVTWERRNASDFGLWCFSGEVPADVEGGQITVTTTGGDDVFWRVQQWTGQEPGANGDNAYAQQGIRGAISEIGVNLAPFSAPENRANFSVYCLLDSGSTPGTLTLSSNLTELGRVSSGAQYFFLMGEGAESLLPYEGIRSGGSWVFEGLFSEMVAAT